MYLQDSAEALQFAREAGDGAALDHLSKQLLLVAGVALIASRAMNLSRGYSFNAMPPAAVAFAIAAVPVQLPMVVTTILAWGTGGWSRSAPS